jgi:hypothetical protein
MIVAHAPRTCVGVVLGNVADAVLHAVHLHSTGKGMGKVLRVILLHSICQAFACCCVVLAALQQLAQPSVPSHAMPGAVDVVV